MARKSSVTCLESLFYVWDITNGKIAKPHDRSPKFAIFLKGYSMHDSNEHRPTGHIGKPSVIQESYLFQKKKEES
jgi:hypothetical protein